MENREVEGPTKLDTEEQIRTRAEANRIPPDLQRERHGQFFSTMDENMYHDGGVDDRGVEDHQR